MLDRLDGYKKALRDSNIEFDAPLVQNIKESGFTESFSDLFEFIVNDIKATAIFAMNDLLAADVYYHADNLGVLIPKDISIVGYDDLPFSERLKTPLTTMHQPLYQMGRESFTLLMERVHKPHEPFKKVVLPNRLVVRKSVKKI